MPLYVYQCDQCDSQLDRFYSVADRHTKLACECGGPMKKIIARGHAHSDIDVTTDDIDGVPRHINSRRHLRDLMREKNVIEKFGRGWW